MEKQKQLPNPNKLRNLKQYKDMSDEEFDTTYSLMTTSSQPVAELNKRIEEKMKEFENDYDMSDMKVNDLMSLRSLIQAIITLEDLTNYSYRLRTEEGITLDNLTLLEKVAKQMTDLRSDIASLQDVLKISRKIRKGDKEATVLGYIDDLKRKAKEFYDSKMSYVTCPHCHLLLATVWTLYPDQDNKFTFVCERCKDESWNGKFAVTTKELKKSGGSNNPDILPDEIR